MRRPAPTSRTRRARVARCRPDDPRDLFDLRDAIATDPDAEVRVAALLRLDEAGARALAPYAREATRDPSRRVREAAFVALARARDAASLARAAEACRVDRSFRVRRKALLFAARTCGHDALAVLALASRDPFWRVRIVARRVAAALDLTVDVRPGREDFVAIVPGFDDPDPAVVTSRVAAAGAAIDPALLVGALASSHGALRRLAVAAIGERADHATLRAATRWLADERTPYGPAAAEAALTRSGPRGAAVAAAVLASRDEPAGIVAWALAAAVLAPSWGCLEPHLAADDARVRRAALARAPEAAPDRASLFTAMRRALLDTDEKTSETAAAWLASTRSHDARAALAALDPRALPPRVRSLLVDLHADRGDIAVLRALAHDPHGSVRAAAVESLAIAGALTAIEREALAADPDPWVRRAALPLLDDPAWPLSAVDDPDPDLRARAADLLAADASPAATRALLRLARDVDLGVRSAAVASVTPRAPAVRALLASAGLAAAERIAAHTLLVAQGAPVTVVDPDPTVRAHCALLDAASRPHVASSLTPAVPVPALLPSSPHSRPLGHTGLSVSPFGLSGAHGLTAPDFALARERGVTLFFWEPGYLELARFLRAPAGRDAVVVAGTYHADAASITRDAERALRALRRDRVDVFLAFWTRSTARLDEVTAPLRALVGRGLARAVGVSTHDRALACDAVDRGLDVVMVRHSAAHRGAEEAVFPACTARGAGVLTFSNLCYGRMLHRSPAPLSAPVTAADCYRYSLSQPGVHACIAAPRRRSELLEDLAVAADPTLGDERQAELRVHGVHVYARSKAWAAETWSVADPPSSATYGSVDVLSRGAHRASFPPAMFRRG